MILRRYWYGAQGILVKQWNGSDIQQRVSKKAISCVYLPEGFSDYEYDTGPNIKAVN